VAQTLCRIIVTEASLPNALKSVKTLDAGGVAGQCGVLVLLLCPYVSRNDATTDHVV
jgi:hypothetical protein